MEPEERHAGNGTGVIDVKRYMPASAARVACMGVLAAVILMGLPMGAGASVPHRARCRHGTVAVKFQGRTRCLKLHAALPRPQRGDPRVAVAQAALAADAGIVRDRRGRRLKPLKRLISAHAYRAILHNLPPALARLDAVKSSHRGRSVAQAASTGCQSGLPETSAHYNGSDGTAVGLRTRSDGSASAEISTAVGNGLRVSVEFDVTECNYSKVPSCPTADGQLNGTDRSPLHVRITVSNASGTVRSESVTTNSVETLVGEVADDAKIDELIVNDDSSFAFVFSGSEIGHVISERATISRQAILNMRFGHVQVLNGSVAVSQRVDGVALTRAELAGEEQRVKASFDQEFARIIQREVDRYRNLETGFDTPNTCVLVAFSPTSNTTTITPGSSGSFTSRLDMKEGAGSPEGRWTIENQSVASFTPTTAGGHQTTFRYTVPSKPAGSQITASLKATSKAGVAAAAWEQRLQPGDLYFRITNYSDHEQSATAFGDRTVTDALSGGPGPVTTVPACAEASTCDTTFALAAKATTTETGHVTGTPTPGFCPFDYGTSVIPNNPFRVPIAFNPAGSAPATSLAAMLPSVGDVLDDHCGADDFGDPQSVPGSVPIDRLLSGQPVTFTFSGSGTVPSDGDHRGTGITWSLSESATVQRVNADGSPLS
jgi:hypothetical protein